MGVEQYLKEITVKWEGNNSRNAPVQILIAPLKPLCDMGFRGKCYNLRKRLDTPK